MLYKVLRKLKLGKGAYALLYPFRGKADILPGTEEARALLEALNADALHERKKSEPCEALLSEFQQEKARENTEFLSVLCEGHPEQLAGEDAARSARNPSNCI